MKLRQIKTQKLYACPRKMRDLILLHEGATSAEIAFRENISYDDMPDLLLWAEKNHLIHRGPLRRCFICKKDTLTWWPVKNDEARAP